MFIREGQEEEEEDKGIRTKVAPPSYMPCQEEGLGGPGPPPPGPRPTRMTTPPRRPGGRQKGQAHSANGQGTTDRSRVQDSDTAQEATSACRSGIIYTMGGRDGGAQRSMAPTGPTRLRMQSRTCQGREGPAPNDGREPRGSEVEAGKYILDKPHQRQSTKTHKTMALERCLPEYPTQTGRRKGSRGGPCP